MWILCIASVVAVIFGNNIHDYLLLNVTFYNFENANIVQIVFSVLAGIFATKATDSSRELRELLKIRDIDELVSKANEEDERLRNLKQLVDHEVQQQFARDMLLNHRQQLAQHWNQILRFEALLDEEDGDVTDARVRELIRNYLVRSEYLDDIGTDFLRSIPMLGVLLEPALGPLWRNYYRENRVRINRILKVSPPDSDIENLTPKRGNQS